MLYELVDCEVFLFSGFAHFFSLLFVLGLLEFFLLFFQFFEKGISIGGGVIVGLFKRGEDLDSFREVFGLSDVKGSLLIFTVANKDIKFLLRQEIIEHFDIFCVRDTQVE